MRSARAKFRSEGRMGPAGRLFLTCFFLIFLAAGLFFTTVIFREVFRAAATYRWQKVECEIVSSAVAERRSSSDSSRPYWFDVKYTYSFAGELYSSEKHLRAGGGFADYSQAKRLADRYSPGSKIYCYVNPTDPTEAVLERQSLWLALAIPFPLIFVAIGAGGGGSRGASARMLRPRRRRNQSLPWPRHRRGRSSWPCSSPSFYWLAWPRSMAFSCVRWERFSMRVAGWKRRARSCRARCAATVVMMAQHTALISFTATR